MRFSILGLAVFPYLAAATVALYGQCGGSGYTGDTTCVSGAVCTYQNDWYSQCLAGSATTTTTSRTSTTTSKTTSTTSKTTTTTTKTSTSAGSSSTVPSGAITVGKNGEGKYTTITAALADTSSNIIYVYAGNYTEAVLITRSGITIYGATSNKLAYSSNTVTISGNNYAGAAGSDDASGTVRVHATGVKLYNLNIENTFGKPIDQSQAIALSVYDGTFACYACQIRGYQDTLLAETGTQFYGKCLIQGSVDFIFGQTASVWITGGTINTVGSGYITASGRTSADSNYYVIDKTTVTGTGSVYLGRPWGDYARVIFQNSVLGSNIVAAGWSQWSSSTPNTDHVTFGEYNNSGAGAWNSARASFATKLSAGISITTVLSSTTWIDSAYL